MPIARCLAALIAALASGSVCSSRSAHAVPTLHYVFDKGGTQNDVGRLPASNGALQGQAAFRADSPEMFSCGSLDLTPNGAKHNYVGSGADVDKIDAPSALTVALWVNMRGAPAADDCLVGDMPAGYPPAGQGGWELRVVGNPAAPTASQFALSFQVMQTQGGWNSVQSQPSPPINADNRWVFIAVTYSSTRLRRYYVLNGDTLVQLGDGSQYSYDLLDNTAEFRVGSAGSEPFTDRTPPAWIDDVRVYDRELTPDELNEVWRENVEYSHLDDVPGFVGLGGLPGSACSVFAQSLSADGSALVGQALGAGGRYGYRWKDGTRELLPDLPGGAVNANAIRASGDGSLVVGWGQSLNGTYEAVRWDAAGQVASLGDFPGGELFSTAYGLSNDGGTIVGLGVDRAGVYVDAFRYASGAMHKLGYLPGGAQSAAYDVSADGRVIVGASESTMGTQAFRYQSGVFTPLGDLSGGAFESRANKVAAHKVAVVGWGSPAAGREAVCWAKDRVFGLGDLPGGLHSSEAFGVSAYGTYVVGKGRAAGSTSAGADEAFIWDRTRGMRSLKSVLETDYGLDLTGWRLTMALGISDDGSTIGGQGTNPAGIPDAFLVRLPSQPAPSDLDRDDDVDLQDLEVLTACASGAAVLYDPASLPAGCPAQADTLGLIAPDLDWDGDVDETDFGILQRCLSGSGVPVTAGCRG